MEGDDRISMSFLELPPRRKLTCLNRPIAFQCGIVGLHFSITLLNLLTRLLTLEAV